MIHYFDNAATTPVRPEAVQAAVEAMTEGWGNPSSRYALGREAAARVAGWRGDVAAGLGCRPEEVFFTSCGSEGDNWAIRGRWSWESAGGATSSPPPLSTPRCWSPAGSWSGRGMR